jgi:acetyl-CoA C-acetyltransferase
VKSDQRVVVAGYGMTDFGKAEGRTIIDLAAEAASGALESSGLAGADVDVVFVGTFASAVLGGQNFASAVLASRLGLEGVAAYTVEAACASGSAALRQAINTVRLGDARVALVVGAEKMTGNDTAVVTSALSCAADTQTDSHRAGLTFPGFFALMASAYLAEHRIDGRLLAEVSVKNRRAGARNPHAHFQAEVTLEQVLASRMIAEPLRLFDCSPISDGAAAVVIADPDVVHGHVAMPVEVLACEQATGPTSPEHFKSFLSLPAAVEAARRAFERSGLAADDIDVAEVHDCFSIAEWIAIEDLGFVPRGGAPAATVDGETSVGGRIPINPSGGLLSKGHPVGATGIGQVVEIVRQLRGEADNQVDEVEFGLSHNVGGTGGLASVTILGRAA